MFLVQFCFQMQRFGLPMRTMALWAIDPYYIPSCKNLGVHPISNTKLSKHGKSNMKTWVTTSDLLWDLLSKCWWDGHMSLGSTATRKNVGRGKGISIESIIRKHQKNMWARWPRGLPKDAMLTNTFKALTYHKDKH